MFVKIVDGKKQTVYECSKYSIEPPVCCTGGDLIELLTPSGTLTKESAVGMTMYVQNDVGKTIDTFYF